MLRSAASALSIVGNAILPIPGGFKRGQSVYWLADGLWVSGKVKGRRNGQVEVEYRGVVRQMSTDDLCNIPGGFSVGEEVYHCGEPDPLVPDRAAGIVEGVEADGRVKARFPGDGTSLFDHRDLTTQAPGSFRPGVYTMAEYTCARRQSRWAWTGFTRPKEVEGSDMVPGTRIVVLAVMDDSTGLGKPGEILGTLDPAHKVYPGQQSGDLIVLQSVDIDGDPHAAVIGEPQPAAWNTGTVVTWKPSPSDEDGMEDDDSGSEESDDELEEIECRVLDWNGRRMQWQVQAKGNPPFWADVDELQAGSVSSDSRVDASPCRGRAGTAVDFEVVAGTAAHGRKAEDMAEMRKRLGSIGDFSPAPRRPRVSLGDSVGRSSVGSECSEGGLSTGSLDETPRRRIRRQEYKKRKKQKRDLQKQLANEAKVQMHRRRAQMRQEAQEARQAFQPQNAAGIKRNLQEHRDDGLWDKCFAQDAEVGRDDEPALKRMRVGFVR